MSEPFLIGDTITGGYGNGPDILGSATFFNSKLGKSRKTYLPLLITSLSYLRLLRRP